MLLRYQKMDHTFAEKQKVDFRNRVIKNKTYQETYELFRSLNSKQSFGTNQDILTCTICGNRKRKYLWILNLHSTGSSGNTRYDAVIRYEPFLLNVIIGNTQQKVNFTRELLLMASLAIVYVRKHITVRLVHLTQ